MNKEEQEIFEILSKKLEEFLTLPEKTMQQGFHKTAEEIYRCNGIKVHVYSEVETKHHTPHIHVVNGSGQEVSISLSGEKLGGHCDHKTFKKIKTFIEYNKDLLQEMWDCRCVGKNVKHLKDKVIDIKFHKN